MDKKLLLDRDIETYQAQMMQSSLVKFAKILLKIVTVITLRNLHGLKMEN